MSSLATRLALACTLSAATLPGAGAAPMTALDLLRQFNVVVSGTGDFAADVGGRTVVGGTLVDGAQFYTQPGAADPSAFRGLTVYGNSTDRNAISVNNGGGATILGTAAGSFNLNGGGSLSVNGTGAPAPNPMPAFAPTFQTPLEAFARDLAGLSANSVWSPNGAQNSIIRASAGSGLAVFSITTSNLQSLKSFSLDLNGRDGAIINVTGNYNGKEDFLNARTLARDVIWNFVDASSVTLGREWGGTVLAANAAVENDAPVHGTLYARSVNADAAWWSAPFENAVPIVVGVAPGGVVAVAVPEPAGLALFGLGLLGLMAALCAGQRCRVPAAAG